LKKKITLHHATNDRPVRIFTEFLHSAVQAFLNDIEKITEAVL